MCLFIYSCNEFEMETTIHPKLTLIAGTVAVEYKLGDLLVLDEWEDLNMSQKIYIVNKDTEKDVKLRLRASDYIKTQFHYTVNGSIKITTSPVEWDVLSKYIDTFPNVIWKTKDSVTISKKNQIPVSPGDHKPLELNTKDAKKL